VLTQRVSEKQTFEDGETQAHLRAERGPIQVILDTSGSMMGTPERVAKAVTLQLLAVAHMEQRRCYVFNFSGLGDLAEHELSFDGDGLMHTLAFISDSFHGGTVPGEAIRRACKRLATHEWRQSDIVLISDGEFTTESPTHRLMKRARRDSAARFHGVRTGTGEGFADLRCDSIHDLLTWFGPTSFMS
jgi:uncharacterized protein with von Willebrand factor type A (vWA) domain